MVIGQLLRSSRSSTGMTQAELARRAGVAQSVVSAYERSRREPSLKTAAKLVEASGQRLEVRVRTPGAAPLIIRLMRHRQEVKRVVGRYGLSNVRVFGSVARGEDNDQSDIDLMVDVKPGVGLFELLGCRRELAALVGAKVDLIPSGGLKPQVAPSILRDAISL